MNSMRNVILMIAFSCVCGSVLWAEESAATRVDTLLKQLPANAVEPVWATGKALVVLGADTRPLLEKRLVAASPEATLALSFALLRMGAQRPACKALVALMLKKDVALLRCIDAAALVGQYGGEYGDWQIRELLKQKTPMPDRLRVELAKSLWKLSHGNTAFEALKAIHDTTGSAAARQAATLALGRFGRFDVVEADLKALAEMPGAAGEEALSLLQLKGRLEKELGADDFPARLIAEIISKVQTYSAGGNAVDAIQNELNRLANTIGPMGDQARELKNMGLRAQKRLKSKDFPAGLIYEIMTEVRKRYAPDETDALEAEQLRSKALANEAARALLGSIDPFNDYLDEDSLRDMREQLQSSYGGIGAWVGMRNGWFTILTPMYDKPAFKAGLRSGDVITKIDKVDITKMRLNKIIKMLKGPPKTDVQVMVQRKGWKEARDFVVMRDTIDIPSVITQRLPGNIGYIRLTSFNEGNAQQKIKGTETLLEEALTACKNDRVEGVILDLTNNPGGLLQTAVGVCRKFLDRNKLIVYSKGREDVYPRQNYYTLNRAPLWTEPLVVMVNGGSASASEIVAGALKDHNRAVLVGQKTFGKGSVQQLLPLRTTRGMTRLKLTIAKYYLPNDECIHKKGIEPHVAVEEPNLPYNESEARWKIRESRVIDKWLEANFDKHAEALRALLRFDGFAPEKYPEMDRFVKEFQKEYPKLFVDPEMVRKEYRYSLRTYLRNSRGEELPVDLEENTILQHALVKLGELLQGGLPALPIYQSLEKRMKAEAETLAAAKAKESPLLEKDAVVQKPAATVTPTPKDAKTVTPDTNADEPKE